ncbi:MAG: O-methyltransferase [Christensenellales bacterium]
MITKQQKQQFKLLSQQCREQYIPVVREKTADLLCSLIEKNKPKEILEIGTAIGYSGTLMLLSCDNSHLTTLDTNNEMCQKALQTFKEYGVADRVNILNTDALEFFKTNSKSFDFIFLDGPKGQYIKYLPYIKNSLNKNGMCFCDDVLYFGMVKDDSLVIHKKITIVRNLREFIAKVQADADFDSELLDIEDGVLLITKK